jgi:hypothetical protein
VLRPHMWQSLSALLSIACYLQPIEGCLITGLLSFADKDLGVAAQRKELHGVDTRAAFITFLRSGTSNWPEIVLYWTISWKRGGVGLWNAVSTLSAISLEIRHLLLQATPTKGDQTYPKVHLRTFWWKRVVQYTVPQHSKRSNWTHLQ